MTWRIFLLFFRLGVLCHSVCRCATRHSPHDGPVDDACTGRAWCVRPDLSYPALGVTLAVPGVDEHPPPSVGGDDWLFVAGSATCSAGTLLPDALAAPGAVLACTRSAHVMTMPVSGWPGSLGRHANSGWL